MADEKIEPIEDIEINLGVTSQNLVNGESGSDERSTEADIYNTQHKLLIEREKLDLQRDDNTAKLEFEKEKLRMQLDNELKKLERELEFKREFEVRKMLVEESKAKTEKITMWSRVGIAGAELISGIGLGVLYLKANLKYGGMIGKDGKKWFDDLKKIKL